MILIYSSSVKIPHIFIILNGEMNIISLWLEMIVKRPLNINNTFSYNALRVGDNYDHDINPSMDK